jgi:hypothetical protein
MAGPNYPPPAAPPCPDGQQVLRATLPDQPCRPGRANPDGGRVGAGDSVLSRPGTVKPTSSPAGRTGRAATAEAAATAAHRPVTDRHGVLALQQGAGNAAVTRLVGTAPEAAAPPAQVPPVLPALPQPAEPPAFGPEPEALVEVPGPPEIPLDQLAPLDSAGADRSAEVLAVAAAQDQQLDTAAAAGVAQVEQAAAAHRAELAAAFAGHHRLVEAAAAGATTLADARAAAAAGTVAGTAATTRQGIGAAAAASGQATEERITGLAEQSQGAGEEQATRAVQNAGGKADAARPEATAADPDVADGQREIGTAVAGKATTELDSAGHRAADQVSAGVGNAEANLYGPARQHAAQQVDTVAQQSDQAVARGEATAAAALAQTRAHSQRVAGSARRTVTQALQAGRRTADADLAGWAGAAAARIRATAQRLRAGLRAQAAALATLAGSTRGRRARSAAGLGPELLTTQRDAGGQAAGGIADSAAGLATGAQSLAGAHQRAVAEVAGPVARTMGQVGQRAGTALGGVAAAFGQHAAAGQAAVADDLQQGPARAAGALAPEHERGLTGLTGVVDDAETAQDAWVADARSRGESGGGRYAGEAQRLANEAGEPVQRLFGELIASMRSWLRENLGDVLGGIVSGLILALPAIAIGVGLLLAGPVGWGVLIGLVVVGAGLGIYGRFQEYAADHGGQGPSLLEGLGLVGLGIADLTGIPYIVEAAVGRRAFSPTPMNDFERWERGTQGVVNLALLALGGAKKLFGRAEPGVPTGGRGGTGSGTGEGPTGGPGPVEGPRPAEPAGPAETPAETPASGPEPAGPITKAQMIELIREIEGGLTPDQFTPRHAAALAENARLASGRWVRADGSVPWDSIANQLGLSRWRFLSRAPEAAAILRDALARLPDDGPIVNGVSAKARLQAALETWAGGGHPPQVVIPPHLPPPPHDREPEPEPVP